MNASLPQKKYRVGSIHAAIWHDSRIVRGEVVEIPSIKFTKAYKPKESQEWKYTDTFDAEDLPKVAMLAQKIYLDLRMIVGSEDK
jgi:hypothetical protein